MFAGLLLAACMSPQQRAAAKSPGLVLCESVVGANACGPCVNPTTQEAGYCPQQQQAAAPPYQPASYQQDSYRQAPQSGLKYFGPVRMPRSMFGTLQPPPEQGDVYPCDQSNGDYLPGSNATCNVTKTTRCCVASAPPPQDCCKQESSGGVTIVAPPPRVERARPAPEVVEKPALPKHVRRCDTCSGPTVNADGGSIAFGHSNSGNTVYKFEAGSVANFTHADPDADKAGKPPTPKAKQCDPCAPRVSADHGSTAFGSGNNDNRIIPLAPGSRVVVGPGIDIEQKPGTPDPKPEPK